MKKNKSKATLNLKIISKYIFFLFYSIYIDAYQHIKRIIKKQSNPHFVEVQLPTNDALILTMMANFITLTPGTITVDIIGNTLLILDIDIDTDPEHTKKRILNIYKTIFN